MIAYHRHDKRNNVYLCSGFWGLSHDDVGLNVLSRVATLAHEYAQLVTPGKVSDQGGTYEYTAVKDLAIDNYYAARHDAMNFTYHIMSVLLVAALVGAAVKARPPALAPSASERSHPPASKRPRHRVG